MIWRNRIFRCILEEWRRERWWEVARDDEVIQWVRFCSEWIEEEEEVDNLNCWLDEEECEILSFIVERSESFVWWTDPEWFSLLTASREFFWWLTSFSSTNLKVHTREYFNQNRWILEKNLEKNKKTKCCSLLFSLLENDDIETHVFSKIK
jgi:hypothetical protein